jgi:hypothetical protein
VVPGDELVRNILAEHESGKTDVLGVSLSCDVKEYAEVALEKADSAYAVRHDLFGSRLRPAIK